MTADRKFATDSLAISSEDTKEIAIEPGLGVSK